jgi:peptidoglycan/xylan/chitin deacetylase (PgdA/CDA1 family)
MRIIYWLELILAYVLFCSGAYWLRRRSLERDGASVVLVYHRVLEGRGGVGDMVGERAFDGQMRYLAEHCRPVGWDRLINADGEGIQVLVTFDDGYRDFFTRALPVLERHGVPSVVFAASELVFNGRLIEDTEEPDDEVFPTRDDLDNAKRSPVVEFGNHTATHRTLSSLSIKECDDELAKSQAAFQANLGVKPAAFAYPRGRREDLRDDAASVFRKHNIRMAFTMIPGLVDLDTPVYSIPRIGMSHVNDPVLFRVKLLGMLNGLVNLKNRLQKA